MINVILVEDDPSAADSLELMLETSEKEIRLLGICNNVSDAIEKINKLKPDLVMLDIDLPDGTGFNVLNKCEFKDFKVIFTTVHSEYAIQAFELSALHYLNKPISIDKLEQALERYLDYSSQLNNSKIVNVADEIYHGKFSKLILPTNGAQSIFEIKDIIRFEADANYTNVFVKPSLKITVSKNLQFYDNLLCSHNFIRIHNKNLINIDHVKKIYRGKYARVLMSDNTEISISNTKKELFFQLINNRTLTG